MASQNEHKAGRIILVVVGLLVLAAMAYFATRYFATRHKSEAQALTIAELREEITELEGDILSLQQQIRDKETSISEKDSLIALRDSRITELSQKLSLAEERGKLKANEVSEMRNRLALVQNQLDNYEEQIASLQQHVRLLRDTISIHQNRVAKQESTLQDLNDQNEAQAVRLEQAAILQAADFEFFRVKKSGKEIEGTSFRDGRLEVLKVCFSLLPNKEAEEGLVPLVLQLVHRESGLKKTTRTQAMYARSGQRVCIPASMPEKVEEGMYEAHVMDEEGNILGTDQFEVR